MDGDRHASIETGSGRGSAAAPRRASGRGPRRPLAFLLHSLFGLKISLFTLLVCITGTIAVVSEDLEWLCRPEVRASALGEAVSWGERYQAARAAFPGYTLDYAIAGEEPYLATRFLATNPAGETRNVYVDPATGRVTGESGWITLPSFMRALHYLLFLPGDWGFYPVTALGVVLMVSLVSGFIVYKKFWRGFFRTPRLSRGARVMWGDLHRLVGLWSAWFVFVIAATSIWYMGERVLYRADIDFETPVSRIDARTLDELGPDAPAHLPLDSLVAIARSALPGLIVKEIWFPAQPEDPLSVRGQTGPWLVRDRTNGVVLNPYTGEVLAVHHAARMPAIERWVHTADPLHFGDFGGLASKAVWFIFGLAMCFSAASGAVIFVKRTAKAVRACLPARPSSRALPGLDFLGRWKWPNLLAISAAPALGYLMFWAPAFAPAPQKTIVLERAPIGAWDAAAWTRMDWPPSDGDSVLWVVRFCEGCYAEIRSARIAFGNSSSPPTEFADISGGANSASASLAFLKGVSTGQLHLWLEVTDWAGRRHTKRWKLPR